MKKPISFPVGLLLVLILVALPGCELVAGIFEAGVWVGAVVVIVVLLLIGFVYRAMAT